MRQLVVFLAALVLLLAVGWAIRPLGDGDILTHIVVGKHLFGTSILTESEILEPVWVSWLAYWMFAKIDVLAGLSGVKGLNLALLWGTFVLAGTWTVLLRSPTADVDNTRLVPLTIGVVSGWSVSLTNAAARPQSFAYLAFAGCLLLLELGGRRIVNTKWLALLVFVVMVLWQNLHPSVVLALPLFGYYIITRRIPVWILALPCLAMLCTPDGWNIFHWSMVNMRISRELLGVSEWLPPWSPAVRGAMIYFWAVAALTTVGYVVSLQKGWGRNVEGVLSLLFLALTLSSSRFGVFWALVNIPVVVNLCERLWTMPLGRITLTALSGRMIQGTLVVGMAANVALCPNTLAADQPLAMLAEVKRNFPVAKIFNYREAGGLLEYVGYPGWRVFVDGRLYLFDREIWDLYHSVALVTNSEVVERVISSHDLLVLDESYHANLIRYLDSRKDIRLYQKGGGLRVYVSRWDGSDMPR
jgi:hypothetical protein